MRTNFEGIRKNCILHKFGAIVVAFATLLAMVLVSGAVSHPAQAAPSDGPFDMAPWIHDVILEHRSGSTGEYTEVKPGEKVSEGDDLQFDMRFEIPQGTLKNTEAGRTVVYHLPAGITPTATSGRMEGVDGTYSISEDGTITPVFDEFEVAINQNAPISHGYVRFESSVDQVNGGKGGSFRFNDKNTVTVKVSQSSDLTVSKKSSNPDPKTGLVKYTVEVNSSKGTAEDVVLNDVMTDNSLVGPISVTNAVGETVACGGTGVPDGVTNFSLTCPALARGDKYVITYQGKADALKDGAMTTGTNSITATSKDGDGNEITDKDSTDVKWDKTPDISKSDGVLNEDGTSTWTVTVNASNTDNLEGWKIEELPNKGTLTGVITVSPTINGQTTFRGFPITFGAGDGLQIYTLTYKTTPASGSTTSADTTNEAKIAPPNTDDDKKIESSGNKEVNPGIYNPLEKTGKGAVTPTGNKNQVNVPWTVTIAPKNEAEKLGAGWTYTDNFNCSQWYCANQYLTADQKTALEEAIKDAFKGARLAEPEITFEENTQQSEVRYGNFTIKSSDGLKVGESITFSYATTGTVSDDALNNQWQQQYQNTGSIGKFSKTASQEYTPKKPQNDFWKVTKTDANGQSNDSAYEYRNLECAVSTTHDDYYGTQCDKPYLHWKVKVDQQVARGDTADYTLSNLTITENLPDKLELLQGLNVSGLTLSMWNVNDTALNIPEDGQSAQTQVTLSGWPFNATYNYAVTVARQGNALSITIPADLLTKIRDAQKDLSWDVRNNITLDVCAGFDSSIDTSKSWKDAKVFANTASLKDASGKEYGESKQSQTISKNDDWNAVQKSHGEIANDGTNAIPYSVTVNPKGNALNEGKPLTLTDKLTYTHESSRNKFNVTLKDITVYEYDANAANHRGKRLTADKWSFSLDEQKGDGNRANTLTVTVPDSTPLVIAYTYQYSGVLGSSVDISNTASMEGVSTSGDKVNVAVHQSSAGSKRSIITVTKADSGNQNIALKGAKFDLYRWDKDKKQYVNVFDENSHLVTGNDGKLMFSTSKTEQTQPCSGASGTTCSSASVKYNTAYMLKEFEAPEGYELSDQAYYFMLVDDINTNFVAPDDFKESNKHYNGDNVFFLNTKKTPGLPSTGGKGTYWLVGGGLLTVLVGAAGLHESLKHAKRSKATLK